MRWVFSADGPGPEYCKACKAKRGEPTECSDCTRPALLPENERTTDLFLAAQTQWRRDSGGALRGFDYSGVQAAAAMSGIEIDRETFEKLRIVEAEAVEIAREIAKRGH